MNVYNIITTNVPIKVIVDESSISNNGVYNKKNNTIMWNIERIDANQKIEVSYKALAPKSTNGKELIGNSIVSSTQQTRESYSNNTIVTLDKIIEIIANPNTGGRMIYIPNTNIGMPINILLFILIISISIIIIKNKLKKINT